MSRIAGLESTVGGGPPGDIGGFMFPASAVAFRFVFSGVAYYAVIRVSFRGWVLVGVPSIVPETPINAAFVALGAGARVVLLDATYPLAVLGISFSANSQVLEGQGDGSFVDGDALLTGVHAINIVGFNNCIVRNLSVQTQDGGGKTCHCVYAINAQHYIIEKASVQASDSSGIYCDMGGETNHYGVIILCVIQNCDNAGISDYVNHNLITECILTLNGNGIELWRSYSNVYDNEIYSNSGYGIYCNTTGGGEEIDNQIIRNRLLENASSQIYLTRQGWFIIALNSLYRGIQTGIELTDLDGGIVSENLVWASGTGGAGDGINTSFSVCIHFVGNYLLANAGNGILITGTIYCTLTDNRLDGNTAYGINLLEETALDNTVLNNYYRNNTSGAIQDLGTNTILHTVRASFMKELGTAIWIVAAGSAMGIDVDAADEGALAKIKLPTSLQQVVRIKVWGTAQVAEADHMRLQVAAGAGGDNEAWNAEAIAVASKASETVNFANLDNVQWTFTVADDADIGDLAAGDLLQWCCYYAAVADGDCATDLLLAGEGVEIHYV